MSNFLHTINNAAKIFLCCLLGSAAVVQLVALGKLVAEEDTILIPQWLNVRNNQSYDKLRPPRASNNNNGSAPINVSIEFYVENIGNFQVTTMDYDLDIYFIEKWSDVRLEHTESECMTLNDRRLLDRVWLPDLYFANSKMATYNDVTVPNFAFLVCPNGLVRYSVRISLKMTCQMNLKLYPFDVQRCTVKILPYGSTVDKMTVNWVANSEPITIDEEIMETDLKLTRQTTSSCNGSYYGKEYSCLIATFTLKRTLSLSLIQIYVPTSFIVIISWISFWIDPSSVPGRVGLAVTTLLTLSTQAAAMTFQLPPVGYAKALDYWLGACLAFLFATLIEFTIVNNYTRRWQSGIRKSQLLRERTSCTKLSPLSVPAAAAAADIIESLERQYANDLNDGNGLAMLERQSSDYLFGSSSIQRPQTSPIVKMSSIGVDPPDTGSRFEIPSDSGSRFKVENNHQPMTIDAAEIELYDIIEMKKHDVNQNQTCMDYFNIYKTSSAGYVADMNGTETEFMEPSVILSTEEGEGEEEAEDDKTLMTQSPSSCCYTTLPNSMTTSSILPPPEAGAEAETEDVASFHHLAVPNHLRRTTNHHPHQTRINHNNPSMRNGGQTTAGGILLHHRRRQTAPVGGENIQAGRIATTPPLHQSFVGRRTQRNNNNKNAKICRSAVSGGGFGGRVDPMRLRKTALRIDHFSRILFPIAFSLFACFYWFLFVFGGVGNSSSSAALNDA